MTTYLDYNIMNERAKKQYKRRMLFAKHWNKVEKIFQKNISKEQFELKLKHDVKSDVVFDNETVLEKIAEHYGFFISNEKLSSHKSIFYLKKK